MINLETISHLKSQFLTQICLQLSIMRVVIKNNIRLLTSLPASRETPLAEKNLTLYAFLNYYSISVEDVQRALFCSLCISLLNPILQ